MLPKTVKNPKVTVYTESHRAFITVPSGKAEKLRCYLQNKGLPSGRPEPVTPGTVSIELPARVDLKAVRFLLKAWRGAS